MTTEIATALAALEQLSSSTSTSSSGPLNGLLDTHFTQAKERIRAGDNPKAVITDLQKKVIKAKKDVEKGLKAWYSSLGNVGKAVDAGFPAALGPISAAYDDPPLFSDFESREALDNAVLHSLLRRGMWDALAAFVEETSVYCDPAERTIAEELHSITKDIEAGNVDTALSWCEDNHTFLQSPPHPSPLPYHLRRSVFLRLPPQEAILYARKYLVAYIPSQEVLKLLTSTLYTDKSSGRSSPNDTVSLVQLFREEFCKRHGWPKEDPLEVVVDLGSRGGALNAIEKARRVMGPHLGDVRKWDELPMEIPLPASRRYHSVFVCPVSKEQSTETNPPKMLTCGHVIASDSFNKMLKAGRRSAKCPYCPAETSQTAAQRLYF